MSNKLNLKFKIFFSVTTSSSKNSSQSPLCDNQSWGFPQLEPHRWAKGLEDVFQGSVCSSVCLNTQCFWLPESTPQEPALISEPTVHTQLRCFFFFSCVTTGNKGDVPFLSILSSVYVPASPHDVNLHPYKDIFCREVFPWCNFGDEQMAIGLWRCYWIVTAGNKVPAEHSTVRLPYSKLSYQHWQLWVQSFFADKVITLDSKALEHCVFGMMCYSLYSH